MKTSITKEEDSTYISVCCSTCGKPVTVVNDCGMYCEDMCGYEADKVLMAKFDVFLKNLSQYMGSKSKAE